ncbi:ribonuclease H-like domain-containing protein [Bacillus taeanensis]|uniref:YprB ribonuclease H-like domain-containing protein n=1 Tax=Bacillus taeanensis TaxID=273032 RepID=A0A366XWC3_9BACI|nr:ribonuclease H-like domain-containing protein [Bacillus taeanensis]RBW69455.1 hypothetical protein DS031_11055 [Bacillus taeanensis]
MSLQSKLNRYKSHLTVNNDKNAQIEKVKTLSETIQHYDTWVSLGAKPFEFENQVVFIRKKQYPFEYKHGIYELGKLKEAVERWNNYKIAHPLSGVDKKAEDFLFFDTETTGLGSGAGNTIFLIGYSRFLENSVEVTQVFLPNPAAEPAFYYGFLNDISELENIVTYNGKSFDWPNVKSRHTFVRDIVPELPVFGHFDLLHGSRRVWKHRLESHRLAVVEKEILQIKRESDVPGYLAPMLYFEYLKEQNPEIIAGVLKHNESDVITLISLYTHLSLMLLNEPFESHLSSEKYEIGRWYEALGDVERAMSYFQKLSESESSFTLKAKKSLSMLYKKQNQFEEAVALWTELSEQTEMGLEEVDIELSKVYEHRYKDFEKALYYAESAYQRWKSSLRLLKSKEENERKAFVKRIERLKEKIERRSNSGSS